MKTSATKNQRRDATAKAAESAANEGHYLDRLFNIAQVLEDKDSMMAVMALRQLHIYAQCLPDGSMGIQKEISVRLLIKAERDFRFTKDQMNRLWYGVHWDSHSVFNLKFPYGKDIPAGAREDK